MKKVLLIGSLVIVGILVFGAVGAAYAQTQNPPMDGERPIGERAIRSNMTSGSRGGMMGQTGSGLLHDYMLAGFAEAFDMTVADLQVRIDAGETMYDVALSLNYTPEQFTELMVSVRTDAINQALADGVITQDQADWMLDRLAQRAEAGFGTGTCTGDCQVGGRSAGRSGGMGMSRGTGTGTGTCIQP